MGHALTKRVHCVRVRQPGSQSGRVWVTGFDSINNRVGFVLDLFVLLGQSG